MNLDTDTIQAHFQAARLAHEGIGVLLECGFSHAHERELAQHEGAAAGHLFRAAELAHDKGAQR